MNFSKNDYGSANDFLEKASISTASQNCVCFTETPLQYLNLLMNEIDNREFNFEPYGIILTKKIARISGLNPVWYIDITAGHFWLINHVNNLIQEVIKSGNFEEKEIAHLAPFIEQMGTGVNSQTGTNYKKEFWWEREWRNVGDFILPNKIIGIFPESEIEYYEKFSKDKGREVKVIDPKWGLEEIIAHSLGFVLNDDVRI